MGNSFSFAEIIIMIRQSCVRNTGQGYMGTVPKPGDGGLMRGRSGHRLTCMYSVRVLKTCLAALMALEKLCRPWLSITAFPE